MTRKPQAKLTAIDPDGGYHTFRTAAGYNWAGLAKDVAGNWVRVTKGFSHDSVQARTLAATRTRWHTFTGETTVARFRRVDETAIPAVIVAYLANHPITSAADAKPTLAAVHYQGQGWVQAAPGQPVTRGLIIRYRSNPVPPTAIAIAAGPATADFQLADLAA